MVPAGWILVVIGLLRCGHRTTHALSKEGGELGLQLALASFSVVRLHLVGDILGGQVAGGRGRGDQVLVPVESSDRNYICQIIIGGTIITARYLAVDLRWDLHGAEHLPMRAYLLTPAVIKLVTGVVLLLAHFGKVILSAAEHLQ